MFSGSDGILSNGTWAANLVPRQVSEILRNRGKPRQIAKDRLPMDILTAVYQGVWKGRNEASCEGGSPALGVDGFPAVTVYAVDAAHVIWHGGYVIQVRCGVDLSAGVEPRVHPLLLGNSIRVG